MHGERLLARLDLRLAVALHIEDGLDAVGQQPTPREVVDAQFSSLHEVDQLGAAAGEKAAAWR